MQLDAVVNDYKERLQALKPSKKEYKVFNSVFALSVRYRPELSITLTRGNGIPVITDNKVVAAVNDISEETVRETFNKAIIKIENGGVLC